MAHKALKGRKSCKKTGVKQNFKQAKAAKACNKGNKGNKSNKGGKKEGSAPAVPNRPDLPKNPAKKAAKKEARQQAITERQHRALYDVSDRILLVGEGNFSFARALSKNLEKATGIYATAYDGKSVVDRKYPDAAEICQDIEAAGGTTLFGVDATRVHKVKEFRKAFSKIVWNFPHIGAGEKDVDKSIAEHRKVLTDFFISASKCLAEESSPAIHVALKAGEPYSSWKVVQTARAACPELDLAGVVQFSLNAFPGYEHRRTKGFDERWSMKDSVELAKGAKVYIFKRKA